MKLIEYPCRIADRMIAIEYGDCNFDPDFGSHVQRSGMSNDWMRVLYHFGTSTCTCQCLTDKKPHNNQMKVIEIAVQHKQQLTQPVAGFEPIGNLAA